MSITGSSCSKSIAVLIADDHRLVREALRQRLLRAGMWIVAEASTPLETVERARHPRAQIVILDLGWGTHHGSAGRDAGLATLLAIRAERASLPVLIYSADGSARSVESCRRLGANGYLIKGVDDSRLIAAVQAVYAGERVWPTLVDSTSPSGASPDSKQDSRTSTSVYVQYARSK